MTAVFWRTAWDRVPGDCEFKDLADNIEAQTKELCFIPDDLKAAVENKQQLVSCSSSSINVSLDVPNYAPGGLTGHSQEKNCKFKFVDA